MESIHGDILGPYPNSILKYKYFFIGIDEVTKFLFGFPMRKRSDCAEKLIYLIKILEKKSDSILKIFNSDGAKEFIEGKLLRYLNEKGIVIQTSAPHCQHDNGLIERAVATTKDTTRSLLTTAQLKVSFWAKAMSYAIKIINVLPKKNQNKSPYEKFRGIKTYFSISKRYSS